MLTPCLLACLAAVLLAAAEQEKLKGDIAATMASLGELDTEAQQVMNTQQELEGLQAQQEQVLEEVAEQREKQQKEVRGKAAKGGVVSLQALL